MVLTESLKSKKLVLAKQRTAIVFLSSLSHIWLNHFKLNDQTKKKLTFNPFVSFFSPFWLDYSIPRDHAKEKNKTQSAPLLFSHFRCISFDLNNSIEQKINIRTFFSLFVDLDSVNRIDHVEEKRDSIHFSLFDPVSTESFQFQQWNRTKQSVLTASF